MGFDIIFFWVVWMMMMVGVFIGEMFFQDVYIYGLVWDEQNCKMSKSVGNGIDLLLLIDCYGIDVLCFVLVWEVVGVGQDICLDYDCKKDIFVMVEVLCNFVNKFWNVICFVLMNLGSEMLI